MLEDRLPDLVRQNYECHEWKHASAILTQDFPSEWQDVMDVLSAFRLRRSWITTPGGRKSKVSEFIDGFLLQRGTRSDELQGIFQALGRGPSYGASATHMSKLLPRIAGGGGAGCPLLAFGIRASLYVEDET